MAHHGRKPAVANHDIREGVQMSERSYFWDKVFPALLTAGVTGVAVYCTTIYATRIGAEISYSVVAEKQKQADASRRTVAKVVKVESDTEDLWKASNGCHACHGPDHPGGKVIGCENNYRFTVKTHEPITLTSTTLHIHRVGFLRHYFALHPSVDVSTIKRTHAPGETSFKVYRECRPKSEYRPEVKSHRITLNGLVDKKATMPSQQLGQLDIVDEDQVEITFALAPDYQKEVQRIGYRVVQVLAVAVFHTDEGIDIPSDPFLISLRVEELSEDRADEPRISPTPANILIPPVLPQ